MTPESILEGERSSAIKFPGTLAMDIPKGQEEQVIVFIMKVADKSWSASPEESQQIDDAIAMWEKRIANNN